MEDGAPAVLIVEGDLRLALGPAPTLLQLMVEKNVLVTLRNPGNATLIYAKVKFYEIRLFEHLKRCGVGVQLSHFCLVERQKLTKMSIFTSQRKK